MVEPVTTAEVVISGKRVGAVYFDQKQKIGSFEYAEEWLDTSYSISPIHLPLSKEIFSFPYLGRDTYHGLPGALADTLPDDFGNAVIDAWLARNGRNIAEFTPVERLLYTGQRGMGALEYLPQIRSLANIPMDINITELVGLTQQVIDMRSKLDVEMTQQGLAEIVQVGTSAGGARPKAVIGINKARDHVLSGQLDLPQDYEHYLIKFDGVKERSSNSEIFADPAGYGRLEYAYHLAAIDAGIHMMPCELLEEGGRAHFLTKRFDRIGNEKIHYQSLCAMAHADFKKIGGYSYEQIFAIMRELKMEFSDAVEMLRRLVFNVVFRNQDDHSKNFGFIYQQNQWRLAPAFDVAFSYNPDSYWTRQHNITINGKQSDIEYSDIKAAIGSSPRLLAELPNVLDQVNEAKKKITARMIQAEVPEHLHESVLASLRDIAP